MFIHLLCLCPPSIIIKLNFNLSKGPYCQSDLGWGVKPFLGEGEGGRGHGGNQKFRLESKTVRVILFEKLEK